MTIRALQKSDWLLFNTQPGFGHVPGSLSGLGSYIMEAVPAQFPSLGDPAALLVTTNADLLNEIEHAKMWFKFGFDPASTATYSFGLILRSDPAWVPAVGAPPPWFIYAVVAVNKTGAGSWLFFASDGTTPVMLGNGSVSLNAALPHYLDLYVEDTAPNVTTCVLLLDGVEIGRNALSGHFLYGKTGRPGLIAGRSGGTAHANDRLWFDDFLYDQIAPPAPPTPVGDDPEVGNGSLASWAVVDAAADPLGSNTYADAAVIDGASVIVDGVAPLDILNQPPSTPPAVSYASIDPVMFAVLLFNAMSALDPLRNATVYYFDVATDVDFTNIVSNGTFNPIQHAYPLGAQLWPYLLPETVYYVRVKGRNTSGDGPFGPAMMFTTPAVQAPPAQSAESIISVVPVGGNMGVTWVPEAGRFSHGLLIGGFSGFDDTNALVNYSLGDEPYNGNYPIYAYGTPLYFRIISYSPYQILGPEYGPVTF